MHNYEDYKHLFHGSWSIRAHEKPTWDYMKTFLSPGCVFFDIGCQKGIFSEGVFQDFGEECTVYAFDALEHPGMKTLQERYNNLHFFSFAIGDGSAEQDCLIDYHSNTRVVASSHSIDQFVGSSAMQHDRIDFIKIDVDGAEENVLRGALQTLIDYTPVIMVEMVNSEKDHRSLGLDMDNQRRCREMLRFVGYEEIGVRNDQNYFFANG
jgi:FkbM family methyltransferase